MSRAEVHACAVGRERERALTEVAFDQAIGDVVAAAAAPANDVFGGHEDATVARLPAAGAALQAVELLGVFRLHAVKLARRGPRVERTMRADRQRARASRRKDSSARDKSSGVVTGEEHALSEQRYKAGWSGYG